MAKLTSAQLLEGSANAIESAIWLSGYYNGLTGAVPIQSDKLVARSRPFSWWSKPVSDDKTIRSGEDRQRIDVSDDECRYWSQKFGVSADELKRPIMKVGPVADDVARALGKVASS